MRLPIEKIHTAPIFQMPWFSKCCHAWSTDEIFTGRLSCRYGYGLRAKTQMHLGWRLQLEQIFVSPYLDCWQRMPSRPMSSPSMSSSGRWILVACATLVTPLAERVTLFAPFYLLVTTFAVQFYLLSQPLQCNSICWSKCTAILSAGHHHCIVCSAFCIYMHIGVFPISREFMFMTAH